MFTNKLGNSLTGEIARSMASTKKQSIRRGYTSNCMLCTTAMDLRRRGFDVRAHSSNDGFYSKELTKWYKDGKVTRGNAKDIATKLRNEPEGSHGNLMITWKEGGGHSLFYRIEKGKVVVYDTQINKVVKSMENFNDKFIDKNLDQSNGFTTYMRTDNLTPDYEYLKKNNLIRY